MTWTEPAAHVFVTGEVVTAATMNTYIQQNLATLSLPISYTPTWTTSGTAPSLGNGQVSGSYLPVGFKLIMIRIFWLAGTTTTFGTGQWSFSLPGTSPNDGAQQILNCMLAVAGNFYLATGHIAGNSATVALNAPSAGTGIAVAVDATHPAAWTATASNFLGITGLFST